MRKSNHLFAFAYILGMVGAVLNPSISISPLKCEAAPNPSNQIAISDVSAPHPKHCIDERQWLGVKGHSPFQLFDGDPLTVWQPCSYALRDAGYTLNIDLKSPISIDGLELSQVASNVATKVLNKDLSTSKRSRQKNKAKGEETALLPQRLEKIQILFFNHEISTQYPVYFQDLLFEGQDAVHVKYDGELQWNPRLLGDSMFDERRRALKLPPAGMKPPMTVHKISLVFPSFDDSLVPPALAELKLLFKGKAIKVTDLAKSESEYGEVMSKVYDLMVKDYMFIGETRTMVFAHTGTVWVIEGEEEKPKVMGGWRFSQERIEIDISSQQQARSLANRRAKLEKKRDRFYKPLHLIVDEAPDRVFIKDGPLKGEYQIMKASALNSKLDDHQAENAPSFEL